MPKATSKDNKLQAGQSLLEVLVALGVFVVGIAAIGSLVLDANVAFRQGGERTQAILLAQEGLEAARSIRDADFDNLTASANGILLSGSTWIFSGTSDTQDQFTRQITVSDIDVDTKRIESAVTWQFTQARQDSVTLVGYLTDWNQTHGEAQGLSADISGAILAANSKNLDGVTIKNTGLSSITIDRMTLWWNNSNRLHQIDIDNKSVFKIAPLKQGSLSGSEVDISNFTLLPGPDVHDITFLFNGSMTGTDFIIKFTMLDNSTKYVLVDL